MTSEYLIKTEAPSVEDYCRMRIAAGLSAKTKETAERGLANSLFAVQILAGERMIGMGRVIGDGGCFYQVVDIAVAPEHQGRGLGKMIMREIMQYLNEHALPSAYVSLIADGKAQELYAQFGFQHTAPRSVGMAYRV